MKKIKTKRLELIEPIRSEAQFYFDLLNSPGWIKNIGDRGIKTNEHADAYIQETLKINNKQVKFGAWTVYLQKDNIPIGFCGLFKRDEFEFPDIGFAILPAYERMGYSYEASLATLAYAKEIGLPFVYGITGEANLASQKLLEKLGLSFQKSIKYGKYNEITWLYSIDLK